MGTSKQPSEQLERVVQSLMRQLECLDDPH
jgi:hypothetical protein